MLRKKLQRGFGRGETPFVVEWRYLKHNVWTEWSFARRFTTEEEAERERKRIEAKANIWMYAQTRVRKIEMPWLNRRIDYRR